MSDSHRWWIQYVFVPIFAAVLGGGGIVLIIKEFQSRPGNSGDNPPSQPTSRAAPATTPIGSVRSTGSTTSSYALANGERYQGEFLNGKKEGKGTLVFPDGTKYIGEFRNDTFNGNGLLILKIGESYEGDFVNGKKHGWGKWVGADGTTYQGLFSNDQISTK